MAKVDDGSGGGVAAAMVVALAMLVAACGPRADGPAPVVAGEAAVASEPERVTVRWGQTLSGIAHAYHVPMRVIAEANHLAPPYLIAAGDGLIIPRAGQPALAPASPTALSVAAPDTTAAAAARSEAPPPDHALGAPAGNLSVAAVTPPPPAAPAAPSAGEPPRPESKPAASPGEPLAETVPPVTAQAGGAFTWPVRGRILSGYGSGLDGTQNDGINIAAPRGTAVEAVDAGVVAYAGNEVRGYGNLLLVKHANGWISAYAHCEAILVKRGDKVARGQVVARVGLTGNVGEPQLHFELRRGNRAVDPREFLAPLPTAGSKERSGPS